MFERAPKPVAPFSHAVEIDGWVFVTGQLPLDPVDDRAPIPEGVEDQTVRVFENLSIVLKGVGLGLGDVVSARVFLTHFERD
jgi:enamine deaminase RidA (YjgF/YER057c/UK114 family)